MLGFRAGFPDRSEIAQFRFDAVGFEPDPRAA
jgi:hypothetical protein